MLRTMLIFITAIISLQVQARDVLQVDAQMFFNQQQVMKSPFVLVVGDSSTLAEEGREGFKVVMSADAHMDNSYTLHNDIYKYGTSGFNLIAQKSIQLPMLQEGKIEFSHKETGPVVLILKVVRKLETQIDEEFSQPVR